MKSKNVILILLALLTLSSAHAESYKFTDTVEVQANEYTGQPNPPTDLLSKTQNISGTTGVISDLNVTLYFRTRSPLDMTFVLVGPNKKGVILTSNAGGSSLGQLHGGDINNKHVTFDDEATAKIPYAAKIEDARKINVRDGSYQLSVYSEVPSWFPANDFALRNPVKSGIFDSVDFADSNTLSAFDDISANGSWELLIYDNGTNTTWPYYDNKYHMLASGMILHDWSLNFTTTASTSGAVPEPAEWMLMGVCACGIVILKLRSRYNQKAI